MAELNNIKQLDGQPWSSWKKLCKNVIAGKKFLIVSTLNDNWPPNNFLMVGLLKLSSVFICYYLCIKKYQVVFNYLD